jgi:hypothetical protein
MLEVMKNMALGLEMAENMAIGVEVTRVRATILQRWNWYGPTPRTMPAGFHQPELREAPRAEPLRETPKCTMVADKTGELNAREGIAFGLQIMGVFMLCGLLTTLGWGGMTGLIVVISKVWPTEEIKEHKDASTSTGSLDKQGQAQLPKPAVVSPLEERGRWEWPRRTVLATRCIRWVNEPTSAASYEQKQGECEMEMSTCGGRLGECNGHKRPRAAGLPGRAEEMKE